MIGLFIGLSLLNLVVSFLLWKAITDLRGSSLTGEPTPEVPVVPLSEREQSYEIVRAIEGTVR